MKLLPLLKILMMPLKNLRVLLYLNIALRILMIMLILLTITKGSLHKNKRLMLCRTMEKEFAETESSLDENEEESDEQKEEEWSSYPSLPSHESNSLTLTLYDCPPSLPKENECYIDCYDSMDSSEISLFDEIYSCGHDAPMNKTCKH